MPKRYGVRPLIHWAAFCSDCADDPMLDKHSICGHISQNGGDQPDEEVTCERCLELAPHWGCCPQCGCAIDLT